MFLHIEQPSPNQDQNHHHLHYAFTCVQAHVHAGQHALRGQRYPHARVLLLLQSHALPLSVLLVG